jgi:hypothetical protein
MALWLKVYDYERQHARLAPDEGNWFTLKYGVEYRTEELHPVLLEKLTSASE